MAAATSPAAQRRPHLLNHLTHAVVDPHLARPETRATTHEVIRALLAPLTRKNCWTLAEQAAHPTLYRIQHLLSRARLKEGPWPPPCAATSSAQIIAAALEHAPGAWAAADEVYGRNPGLRHFLEQQRVG